MWQRTTDLDLESPSMVPKFERVSTARRPLQVNLRNVEVHVFGADGSGRSMAYWQSLRDFWTDFFRARGSVLAEYSALRMPVR